jgi:3-oxoacyl-[acyl-carrier protein] reductase
MMKRVLITGSTRGIGNALSNEFKAKNFYVIGTGTKRLNKIPENLHEYYAVNFESLKAIENFCQLTKKLKIDVLINNAGINIINDFCDIDPTTFLKIQQVNVYSHFRISQSVIPNMVENNWGRIVSISSVWGKKSKRGRASYSVSKFGIDGLTTAMASEFSNKNILCNSVSPGFIDTEMTQKNLGEQGIKKILEAVPINRLANPVEVAKFVLWLSSEDNTYITGQNLSIDGGFSRA